jgi:hypothetical protein
LTTPTTEPTSVRAGDALAWRREDLVDPVTGDEYPASLWTLTYAFKNATLGFEITATADDDDYAVSVSGTTSAAYTAGVYAWQARVSLIATPTTVRYTVDSGEITVLPSLFTTVAADPLDARTFARQALDNAEEAYLAFQTQRSSAAGIKSYAIGNRQMTYADADLESARLISDRDRWRLAVAREEQAEGKPNNLSRNHKVRFVRAA